MNIQQIEQYEPAEPFERIRRSARRGRKYDGRNRERYLKECDGKVVYRTHAEAEIEQAKAMERTGHDFSAYQCAFCGNFHIGHTLTRKIPGFIGR